MFSAQWQYEHMLRAAISEYGIDEYRSGHVVFVFKHKNEEFFILFDMLHKTNEDGERILDFTVITIGQKDDRHYHIGDMCRKEANKVYSDYSLPESFLSRIYLKRETHSNVHFFSSYYFDDIEESSGFANDVDEIRLNSLIIQKIYNMEFSLNKIYWLRFSVGEDKKEVFLRISIEMARGKRVVVFNDVKRDLQKTLNLTKQSGEEIIELSGKKTKTFGKKKEVSVCKQPKGLKIIRKAKTSEKQKPFGRFLVFKVIQ